MLKNGIPKRTILKELESRLEKDYTFESGKIIGSMCTNPHPFSKRVYPKFIGKNVGDAGLFPGVVEIEKEAIHMIGELLSNDNAYGHIVTGGTEANITALWIANRLAKKSGGEVIVPESAHYSFDKAADMLGLKLLKVGLNEKFQADMQMINEAITPRTIALVGMAGTTALGVVDPIPELSEIALDNRIYLHVDAAFGGFVLPFLKPSATNVPQFDFALQGVKSVTVDPHKMGLAAIPAGGILFRNEAIGRTVGVGIPYLSGGEIQQDTIVGTRSGASIIAVWALMKHLGKEGYMKIVDRCIRLTMGLADEIPRIEGMDVVTKPMTNVVGLKSQTLDIREVAQQLRLRGWAVSLFPKHIRIVVMPHVRQSHLRLFLEDLEAVANRLSRGRGSK
jgi:tyrosine decarboxylase/aspartate 1-decarboxylase